MLLRPFHAHHDAAAGQFGVLTGRARRARRVMRRGWPAERAVRQAQQLVARGQSAAAARLLTRTVLSGRDPGTAPVAEDLIRAASLYVVAVCAGPQSGADVDAAPLAWAWYAYRAAHRLHTAGPVPHLVLVAADALGHALHRAGRFDEAVTAYREAIDAAAELGDIQDGTLRRLRLAESLHRAGRCSAAHQEASAAIGGWLTRDPAPAPVEPATIAALFAMLESCHRHDEATALAARLGPDRWGHGGTWQAGDDRCTNLPDRFAEHATRHHTDAVCGRADCPVTLGGQAFGARLYAALLSGTDPDTAGPDAQFEVLAGRFLALPESDRQTATSAAGWAGYLCRHAVLRAAHHTGTPPFTADTLGTGDTPDQLDDLPGWEHAARLLIDVITEVDHPAATVSTRIRLAFRLHHAGRCDDGLAEARVALAIWQAQPSIGGNGDLTHRIRVAALFDGCHRHDEALQLLSQFHPDRLAADGGLLPGWLSVLKGSRVAMVAHARAFHPEDPCTDRGCRQSTALAVDLPHSQLLRALLPLHQQGRTRQVLPALAAHLASFDPADSTPGTGLAGLAVLYALHAVTDSISQPASTVLGWAAYACRAAAALDHDELQLWPAAHTALLHAAVVYDARDQAVDAARALLTYHTRTDANDATAALNARLSLAQALHTAGSCPQAADHALAGWAQAAQQLRPHDPAERRAALIAGIDTAALLDGCHRHHDAADVRTAATNRFRPPTADDGTRGDDDRIVQETAAALRTNVGEHSAEFHADDPCAGERHDAHLATAITVLLREDRSTPSATGSTPRSGPQTTAP